MSEPASLYARLTFDEGAYAAFLSSTPTPPTAYDDWQAWLDRQLPGTGPLPSDVVGAAPLAPSIGALFEAWQGNPWLGAPPITVDATGRCEVALLHATENYYDLIQLVAPLRGAATWTRPDADDFILVTDFLWDEQAPPMAGLRLGHGGSSFVAAIPDVWRREATAAWDAALAHMQAAHSVG